MNTRRTLEAALDDAADAIEDGRRDGFSIVAHEQEAARLFERLQDWDVLRGKIRVSLDSPRHTCFINWPIPSMRDSIAELVADALWEE